MSCNSIHFTIEVGPSLVKPCRKPKFLSARMMLAKKEQHYKNYKDYESKENQPQQAEKSISPAAEAEKDLHLQRHDQFLMSRKMKLQKRLEYVSNVLATQRAQSSEEALSVKKSLLDQTLANAERNRYQRLRRLSQSNGNHVKRAKAIAKSSQQKFIEDRVLLARSIDRKRKISDSFRSSFSLVPRSKLLDPASKASLQHLATQELAATFIQNWYRKLKFSPICKIYKKIGLSREKASTLSFDQLTSRIANPTVIKATGFLLIRAMRISGIASKKFKNPARVLNSAFMFTFFPSETLTVRDGQEEDLEMLADQLISNMDYWISSSSSSVIASLAKSFMTSFKEYYAAFEAWKSKDTFKIIDELISYFMELDAVWIKVIPDDGAMEEWAEPIQQQQSAHLKRIEKFGEHAVLRLIGVRKEYIKSVLDQDEGLEIVKSEVDTVTASQLYIVKKSGQDTVMNSSSTESLVKEPNEKPNEQIHLQQKVNEFGSILSNEMIAHELLLDPSFSLKPVVKSELEERVSLMAKKAFIESVSKEIREKEYSKTVFSLLMEIQSGLLAMVNESGPIAQEIKEVFDSDFLHHQITNNVFDLYKLIKYTGEKMLQLCAPVRDAEINALTKEENMATVLITMLDIFEKMKLDLANFRLKSIKPELKRQAVEYERGRFCNALENGEVSLIKTESWLISSFKALEKIAAERNPENIDRPDLKIKFGQVFNHAFLSLLFSTTPIDQKTLAETFSMDQKRIFELQNEIQACTIVSALTLLSKNIIPQLRADEAALQDLANSLFRLLKEKETSLDRLSQEIIDSANLLIHKHQKSISKLSEMTANPTEQAYKSVTSEQETMIISMVEKTVSYKDAFFSVLSRRLERIVKDTLEKNSVANSNGNVIKSGVLKKNGLEVIEKEFSALVERIGVLVKYNREVYGPLYDDILKKYIV